MSRIIAIILYLFFTQAYAQSSRGVPQDINQDACLSKKVIVQLERSNNLTAVRRLAKHYGACVEDSEVKVIKLYERAAEFGFGVDVWNLAVTLDEVGESERAFPLLLDIAKRGDRDAIRKVAAAYRTGDGVIRDLTEAANWYENDASRCNQKSAGDLAALLESSQNSRQYVRALAWLTAAKGFSNRPLSGDSLALENMLRKKMTTQDVQLASTLATELAVECVPAD